MKICQVAKKFAEDKQKLLVKELNTLVDKLFHDSIDKVRDMSTSKAGNKKRGALIIPKLKKKK